jgi:hypothetical protein
MQNLNRIRFLAANYASLQGLKYVPIGLMTILMSLWGNSLRKPATDLTLPILVAIGGGVLYLFVDRYYAHVFGNIQRPTSTVRLEWLIQTVGGILALIAFAVDVSFKLPVSTLGLVFSAALLADYLRITRFAQDRFLLYYPFIAVGMIALSVLPLVVPLDWWQVIGVHSPVLAILTVFGLLQIVIGVLLHWFLIHSLPPLQEANNG